MYLLFIHKVAAQVMSQSNHVIRGATLSLQYFRQPNSEYKMNQLLIRGIPCLDDKYAYELILADDDCLDTTEFELSFKDDSSALIVFAKHHSFQGKQYIQHNNYTGLHAH